MSCSRDKPQSSDRNVNSRHPVATYKSVVNRSISQEGSCSSLASETSSDYAFPPDDGASLRTDSSDVCLATTTAKSAAAASLDSYKKVRLLKLSLTYLMAVYARNTLDCDQSNYSSRIVFSHIPIEFGQKGISAIRSANPKNPILEPNTE